MPKTATQTVRELWPKRRVDDLRDWLAKRYPSADANLVGVAAQQIDGHIRVMLRGDRRVMIKTSQRGRSASLSVTHQPTSLVEALRAVERNIGKPKLYAKNWVKLPADALALIEQARGVVGWSKTIPGITGPIPAPDEIAPIIGGAIALASEGRLPHWRRDRTVEEIGRLFEQITGERPRQASKAGTSRRSGTFVDFLDLLELFYNSHLGPDFELRFGVQRNGRAMSRIFRRSR
ncbi:hypothetical protein [Bradyrhizobium sp. URHD0069]|uniref:hypothetical protein n=1 Tax=Bradyrhizobium sp. URHD0069 TaxID=1380355 RepID=UPI0012DCB2EF|nr:hypothetical protein [Bradyrhizobium sp. URHD0069]